MTKLTGTPSYFSAIDKTTWILWVFICGLNPVLLIISGKLLFDETPIFRISITLTWILILGILSSVPILQYLVLRRVASRLNLGVWFFTALLTGIISIYWKVKEHSLLNPVLSSATLKLRLKSSVHLWDIVTLPWFNLVVVVSVGAFLTYFLPSVILAKATNRKWSMFIVSAIVGSNFSALIDHLYRFFDWPISIGVYSSGSSFKIVEYIPSINSGVVWGATAGMALVFMMSRFHREYEPDGAIQNQPITTAFMVGITIAVLALPPLISFGASTKGWTTIASTLRKSISFAPDKDTSTGENILSYSHNAEVKTPDFPVVHFAPDSSSFIVRNNDSEIVLIDLKTGAKLKQLMQLEGKYDQYEPIWSADNRFLVIRTSGEEVKIPDISYTRKSSLFRLYALPEYKLLGEFTHRADDCFDAYAPSMTFENDSKSIWLLCKQYYSQAKSDKVMAIKLAIPSMKAIEIRRYKNITDYKVVEYIGKTNESVITWQEKNQNDDRILLTDLTHDKQLPVLTNLTHPTMGGKLTRQSGQTEIEKNQVKLLYCGSSSAVIDPQVREMGTPTVHGFCRTLIFDLASGQLLKKIDELKNNALFSSVFLLPQSAIRINSIWEDDSKTGLITLENSTNNQQLQKIETLSQRLLNISPDKHWLVTHAFNQHALRVYMIKETNL